MMLSVIWFGFRYSCEEQGVGICNLLSVPSDSGHSNDSLTLHQGLMLLI